jgi:predicted transcriptional regulator YdeE
MLKNITLSAEDLTIQKAREKAGKEQKTLNNLFREWLKRYINNTNMEDEFERFMERTGYVNPGKKFTKEELNAR